MQSNVHVEYQAPGFVLSTRVELSRPPDELFSFFGDAFNLEEITPPFLKFRVLAERPFQIREGTLIDYRLSLHGVPINWRTRIRDWNPPYGFTDEQITRVKDAYKILFRSKMGLNEALSKLKAEHGGHTEIDHLIDFLNASKRGVTR